MGLADQKIAEIKKNGVFCWLMKSEPTSYSIDHLKKEKKCIWDGVRNYQSRNFMQNTMKPGDAVLFYHSNTQTPGVVGLAEVAKGGHFADPTQFDPQSNYYDPKASHQKPIWYCIEVVYKRTLPNLVSLNEIKSHLELKNMLVAQKGMRLSIQPVTHDEYLTICNLGGIAGERKVENKNLTSIDACETLDQLCNWLREKGSQEISELTETGEINFNKLPNFGGDRPKDSSCLSYDETRILIEYQTCDYEKRFALIKR